MYMLLSRSCRKNWLKSIMVSRGHCTSASTIPHFSMLLVDFPFVVEAELLADTKDWATFFCFYEVARSPLDCAT